MEAAYDPSALSRRRLAQLALDRGGLITLVVFALYVWIAPTTIVYGDNAEFSALGQVGGVAHPSGYPLYVLWLRAWSWLPAQSPAHAAALATAILTALQVLVLHAACRAWGARPLAATLAVGLLAAGPVVLRIQSEAEVFALNNLIAALVLWLAAAAGPLRGRRRVLALGLIAGLGMANHLTCVLVAPIGILGAWRGIAEDSRSRLGSGALAVAGLLIGLLPYGYLIIAPDTAISWRAINGLGDIVHHILREDYGGPAQFSPVQSETHAAANLWVFVTTTGRAYLWLPAVLAVGALGYFAIRRDRVETRVAWALLAASWLLAGPILVSRFNIPPIDTALYVVQRFHLLALLLLAIPIAVGVDRAFEYAASRVRIPFGVLGVHAILTVVGFVAICAPSLPYVARMHSPAIEAGLGNMLRTLPPNAIVIGSSDAYHFGLGYLQVALGERPDVSTIMTGQLPLPSYRDRLERRTGIRVVGEPAAPGTKPRISTLRVAELALATGRPVFIDPFQAAIAAGLPTYPFGLLFRVLPRDAEPPTIQQVFEINKELYGRYQFGYAFPSTDDQLATDFHEMYARAWRLIAKGLERGNRTEALAFARGMIAELEPRAP